MIALIALRLPVLGFCLCENDVILNGGACCEEAATEQSSCGSCPEILCQTEKKPCRDCVVILSLDPGDFQWTASQFSPSKEDPTPLDLPLNFCDDLPPKLTSRQCAAPIRGSPLLGNVPLYLRIQVLRL
jgi:hypothetical protein